MGEISQKAALWLSTANTHNLFARPLLDSRLLLYPLDIYRHTANYGVEREREKSTQNEYYATESGG